MNYSNQIGLVFLKKLRLNSILFINSIINSFTRYF